MTRSYSIYVTRHWYGPRNTVGYATDERGEVRSWPSWEAARAERDRLDAQVYELAHGECSRPTYEIRRDSL